MIQNSPVSRSGATNLAKSASAPTSVNGPIPVQPLFAVDTIQTPGVVKAFAPATALNFTATALTAEDTRWALALEEQLDQSKPISTSDLQRYQHIADHIAQQQAVVLLQRLEQQPQPLTEAEQQWCQTFEANPNATDQARYDSLVERHLASQNQDEGPLPVLAEELSWANYMYQRSHQGYQVKPHEQRLYQLIAERYQ